MGRHEGFGRTVEPWSRSLRACAGAALAVSGGALPAFRRARRLKTSLSFVSSRLEIVHRLGTARSCSEGPQRKPWATFCIYSLPPYALFFSTMMRTMMCYALLFV